MRDRIGINHRAVSLCHCVQRYKEIAGLIRMPRIADLASSSKKRTADSYQRTNASLHSAQLHLRRHIGPLATRRMSFDLVLATHAPDFGISKVSDHFCDGISVKEDRTISEYNDLPSAL